MTHLPRPLCAVLTGALMITMSSGGELFAQTNRLGTSGADEPEWELPTDPDHWINSPPLSADALAGKGVVFFFFDEGCPVCVEAWPVLQRRAEPYAERPVLFIGVNSGTDPRELRNYVRQNRVAWPVIADVDRSLESAMGVPRLETPEQDDPRLRGRHDLDERLALARALEERDGRKAARSAEPVAHVKYRTGQGGLADGDPQDFAGTAEKALQGASWRVDPAGIPAPLRGAWRAIEVGAYADAAPAVTKAAKAKGGPLKSGADLLLDAVKEELTEEATVIREALAGEKSWEAYKLLNTMVVRYDGYGLTQKAEAKRDELAKLESVQGEIDARKTLDKAIRTGSKGSASAVRRARGMLDRLIESSPGTEAADEAKEILANLR